MHRWAAINGKTDSTIEYVMLCAVTSHCELYCRYSSTGESHLAQQCLWGEARVLQLRCATVKSKYQLLALTHLYMVNRSGSSHAIQVGADLSSISSTELAAICRCDCHPVATQLYSEVCKLQLLPQCISSSSSSTLVVKLQPVVTSESIACSSKE
jgi:hypothetical protein